MQNSIIVLLVCCLAEESSPVVQGALLLACYEEPRGKNDGNLLFLNQNLIGILVLQINALLIKTKFGYVNGTSNVTNYNKPFKAYYGIPYALSPTGNLRFQPPVPHSSWKGIWDATRLPNICIQIPHYSNTVIGSEDCLNLNIYTPLNATSGANIPVLFYIHGGIFKFGSNFKYGPEYFMNRDIIIVMPNYRMGALGFLSTGDEVIPGNMGLKDQSLAMKWVKENIDEFGGDPNQITLTGHSSGSISVHLHTLSPMSKGLFNRVIMMSGNGFCYPSFFDKNVMKSVTKELVQRVGCSNTTTSQNILNCLLKISPYKFSYFEEDMRIWHTFPDNPFVPNLSPYQSTDTPWLLGVTSGEGEVRTELLVKENLVQELNAKSNSLLPITVEYQWHMKSKYLKCASNLIRHHYFHNEEISNKTLDQLVKLYTHGDSYSGIVEAMHRFNGTKYMYLFDYKMESDFKRQLELYGTYFGPSHAAKIPLFFNQDNDEPMSSIDRQFGDELIKRWVNFIITGDPNKPLAINETMIDSWDPIMTSETEYLHLKMNGSMKTNFFKEDCGFWKKISRFNKHY